MTRVERGDVVTLTRELVRADSRNPSLVSGARGEGEVARLLAGVLRDWGFAVELIDAAPGRPNLIARAGSGGGRTLMLNGHLDVVGVEGMTHAPFSGELRDGRVYGRGATDMKGGIAAMCCAAARAVDSGIAGEVVITAVVDEETTSLGTRALLASGVRADAAIVTEPTRLAIAPAHRGFVWLEVTFKGRAAHGSQYDLGVDSILHAARALCALGTYEREVLMTRTHPLLGRASLHASAIEGGEGWSTYPERCMLRVERRTVPGETAASVAREMHDACAEAFGADEPVSFATNVVLVQSPSDVPTRAPVVRELEQAIRAAGRSAPIVGLGAWTDAALLNAAGVPAICFGPGDIALAHAAEEFVEVRELEQATDILARFISLWCGSK